MFKKILLPLDGSELAEVVLPYGEELASRLDSELILFHVCNPEHQQYHHMHCMYLSGMGDVMRCRMRRARAKGGATEVKWECLIGQPVETICDYIEKNDIGLMVMAASGASGLKLAMMGSVADKVFRTVKIPAMLVRARAAEGKKRLINRILVPLDGSEASRVALPVAGELALKLKASVTLFQMAQRILPSVPMRADQVAELAKVQAAEKERARTNLLNVEKGLRQKGIAVTHQVVSGDDPATAIMEAGRQANADLVIMSTRGHAPLGRWVLGSTADKTLRQGNLPLILVRQ